MWAHDIDSPSTPPGSAASRPTIPGTTVVDDEVWR